MSLQQFDLRRKLRIVFLLPFADMRADVKRLHFQALGVESREHFRNCRRGPADAGVTEFLEEFGFGGGRLEIIAVDTCIHREEFVGQLRGVSR